MASAAPSRLHRAVRVWQTCHGPVASPLAQAAAAIVPALVAPPAGSKPVRRTNTVRAGGHCPSTVGGVISAAMSFAFVVPRGV